MGSVLVKVLKQLRREQLEKKDLGKDLKKLRVELKAHERLLEVNKLGEKRGGVKRGRETERELRSALEKEDEWRRRLLLRMKRVRTYIKDARKKLFVLSHVEGQFKRSLAGLRVSLSKVRELSTLSSKLNLWTFREQKSRQELLDEHGRLMREFSRRNGMRRKLRKLVAQRLREAKLARKLEMDFKKHKRELLSGQGRKITKINIEHVRSNVRKEHLRWLNMFRDLQRIRSVVAALTKKAHKQHEGSVQAKKRRRAWQGIRRARILEASLRKVFVKRGVLNHRLNRARSEINIQYERSMILLKKMHKRMRYILHEIKSLRRMVKHVHNKIRASERGNMMDREMLKARKALSAKSASGKMLSQRVKRPRLILMKAMEKTAKTISELRRLRRIETKVILSLRQTGSAHTGKARIERWVREWVKRRAKLAFVLQKERITMRREIEHFKVEVTRQKKELDDLHRQQHKFMRRLKRRERSMLWAHKEMKQQTKKLRWICSHEKSYSKTTISAERFVWNKVKK